MPSLLPRGPDKSGYLAQDTVAAISSALGGAIAVLRLSGPDAFPIAMGVAGLNPSGLPEPRRLARVRLRSREGVELDDALIAFFPAPDTFTGEDLVEFHVHGGSFVATRILEELLLRGARQALPGEFAFRGVRNGKMSISQAQAIHDLIRAGNDQAVSLALEKLSGTQNALLGEIAEKLRTLAALGELGIDFSDQDVEEVSLPRLKERLSSAIRALERLKDTYGRGTRIQEGLGVAFVGLPNAGKSSFFNALLGEDRSIVSEVEGTTRDVVRERLTLRGAKSSVTLRLEDTAGLRSTRDRVETLGIERAQKSARAADIILFLADPGSDPLRVREQWQDLLALVGPNLPKKTLGILTKTDAIGPSAVSRFKDELRGAGPEGWIATSALSGEGIAQAIEALTGLAERWTRREKGEVLLTRLDHLQAIEGALEHLTRSLKVGEIDLFASDIRQGLFALSPLIGETPPDEILGRIFSEFCIGK